MENMNPRQAFLISKILKLFLEQAILGSSMLIAQYLKWLQIFKFSHVKNHRCIYCFSEKTKHNSNK